MEICRECLDFSEGYWGQASRGALISRKLLDDALLEAGDVEEAYATAFVGLGLAVRGLGISDVRSFQFSRHMILASLAQDDMTGFAAKCESIQDIPGINEKWDDLIGEKVRSSLKIAFARDRSLEQAEFHLGKAIEACRIRFDLERESASHLDIAHNDIWDVVRKHKNAQRP